MALLKKVLRVLLFICCLSPLVAVFGGLGVIAANEATLQVQSISKVFSTKDVTLATNEVLAVDGEVYSVDAAQYEFLQDYENGPEHRFWVKSMKGISGITSYKVEEVFPAIRMAVSAPLGK